MHEAVRLNEVVREKSQDARLIIINLPGLPKNESGENNCILISVNSARYTLYSLELSSEYLNLDILRKIRLLVCSEMIVYGRT